MLQNIYPGCALTLIEAAWPSEFPKCASCKKPGNFTEVNNKPKSKGKVRPALKKDKSS